MNSDAVRKKFHDSLFEGCSKKPLDPQEQPNSKPIVKVATPIIKCSAESGKKKQDWLH